MPAKPMPHPALKKSITQTNQVIDDMDLELSQHNPQSHQYTYKRKNRETQLIKKETEILRQLKKLNLAKENSQNTEDKKLL